jgi:NADH dehydrogenase
VWRSAPAPTSSHVDDKGVVVAGERIASRTVLWTAGVRPSPAGQWLRAETDRAGRVSVQPDLSVRGRPEVFVVGDTAHLEQNGKPLPGVAQVALQQGRYVGKLIASRAAGRPAPPPFRYFDKGNMAVIGRNFAILESGKLRLSGFPAWAAWAAIHLVYLPQQSRRDDPPLGLDVSPRGARVTPDSRCPDAPATLRTIGILSKEPIA